MTDHQWEMLHKIIQGEVLKPLPVGFIIDCPWLPSWYGIRIFDYLSNDELWLNANLKAIDEFPEVMFLPGFWSEFGMCTEPLAFGARCTFPQNEFPHAHKIIHSADDIDSLPLPNPRTDGLLPFVLNRLKLAQSKIEATVHQIRFAVARGPLNIASFLMGTTELLTTLMLRPEYAEALLKKITDFLKDWLHLQMDTFLSIDGIFLLDDMIGFMGEAEFLTFGLPYLKELFDFDGTVRFLHNDVDCKISAPFLPSIGVNLFNIRFDISLNELKGLTQNQVTLLGNIPRRDVLARGNPVDVMNATVELLNSLTDQSKVIFSCGGEMPPGFTSENIRAFVQSVRNYSGN